MPKNTSLLIMSISYHFFRVDGGSPDLIYEKQQFDKLMGTNSAYLILETTTKLMNLIQEKGNFFIYNS